jgi:CDP-paratose 2-epimerase
MATVVITGSAGLVGSEAARFYCERGDNVVGIDNDMRRQFFGPDASTRWSRDALLRDYVNYEHHDIDIRDRDGVEAIFDEFRSDIELVVHAAAQPSHDWAARDPHTDFTINANGTLTMLAATRQWAPEAVFVFTSTNKVYGDRPNTLPLVEHDERWEIEPGHQYRQGIDESMSVDSSRHSIFGASKVAADILVQEYGRYFGMKTVCFRGGCLTGPNHAGAELHGFLSYLVKCVINGSPYVVYGYKGKQVRDNIHSFDLVSAIDHFYRAPRSGEVYNMGGGRGGDCSMREAIALCEQVAGKRLPWRYADAARTGDHIWWISDTSKFSRHYPHWQRSFDLSRIIEAIVNSHCERWV